MPNAQPPRPRGDPLAILVLVAVLAALGGGYVIFPWLLRTLGHVDCIASGHVTGC